MAGEKKMSGERGIDNKIQRVILDVPYYSQRTDVDDDFWKPRACGIVCLKMVMDFYNKFTPPLTVLINSVNSRGGYCSLGWIHDHLVKIAKDYNFSAYRKRYDSFEEAIEEKLAILSGGRPIIISAVKNFSEEDKFHMVVLTGFEKEGDILKGFYYHDPDSLEGETGGHRFVPLEIFKKYWRKMSIYVSI